MRGSISGSDLITYLLFHIFDGFVDILINSFLFGFYDFVTKAKVVILEYANIDTFWYEFSKWLE